MQAKQRTKRTSTDETKPSADDASDHQDVLGELSQLVSEDELLAIMADAEKSDDESAFLRSTLEQLTGTIGDTTGDATEFLAKRNIAIREHFAPVQDVRTRQITDESCGFLIERVTDDGRTLFAGVQLAWTVPRFCTPFDTAAAAATAAVAYVKRAEERAVVVRHTIGRHKLLMVPIADVAFDTDGLERSITVKLPPAEHMRLRAILTGLQQDNARENGQPLTSLPSAVRWLINGLEPMTEAEVAELQA